MTTVRTENLIPVMLAKGDTIMKVLVDDHPDLAVGKWITLDDPELDPNERYEVLMKGHPIKRATVNRGWDKGQYS